MTAKPWDRVAPIVESALLRDEPARAAFVVEACGNDPDLVREVESLLAHASGNADFLSTPALALARSVWSDRALPSAPTTEAPGKPLSGASRLAPGQRVGLYRVERLLGRGGMGEVYEAEHLEHGRRIALKVLSPELSGAIDRARFLREGQLAAAVNHPHVVYIYGHEDIEGMPAIAMELLPGGTLKERVEREGPLVPIAAIDAILQVISGLEAAHRAGVLHRDVKPSNCFVDSDGTVKIGDFGLAIPALEQMPRTTIGTIQATPPFASPEQLRGKPLEVRSDIYAVGATLYYLLTGRPPFDDRDLLALVSRIATESPTSPRELRPEVPRALADVVLQCLAKSPAHRPASYRGLANVLEPLGSTVKMPAPFGIRVAVGILDNFLSTFVLTTPIIVFLPRPSSVFGARLIVDHLVEVAYFAISESVWGASLGKALCGCQVVTECGAPPRFGPALSRALVFVLSPWLASGLVLWLTGLTYSQQLSGTITALVVQGVVTALLFAPARRVNGFAGIHEWVSHTRTVLKPPIDVRGLVPSVPSPIAVLPTQQWVGPYRLVDSSRAQPNHGAALGYDERLRRTVWLRFSKLDSDPVPLTRRTLRRPGRPRWLAGQRTRGLAWDAYEQVPGQPFDALVTRAQSWRTVREWLCDLGAEVHAGLRDGSLPELERDHVWIGDDGRARLLDWSAPNGRSDFASSPAPERALDLPQAERFLYRVSVSALEGHVLADTHPDIRTPQVPLPLAATDCLAKLREQRFTTSEDMLTALMYAARGPAAISRAKRATHLSLCAIPTIIMLVVGLVLVNLQWFVVPRQDVARPDIADLAACLNRLAVLEYFGVPSTTTEYAALEIYIAGQHRDLISNPSTWSPSHLGQRTVSSQRRALAERVIATRPIPQKADSDEAVRILSPFLGNVRSGVYGDRLRATTGKVMWRYFWPQAVAGLMFAGTVGLLSALASRGGIVLRLMSIAVVRRDGTLASGSRSRLRSVLSWLPVLSASAALFMGHSPLLTLTAPASLFFTVSVLKLPVFFPTEPSMFVGRIAIVTLALAVFAVGLIVAVITPERGLQDRLAGTWLVPG